MTADKKTRSPAKRVVAGVVLLTWILATLACARSVGTPSSMAATAWAMQLTAAAPPPGDETLITPPAYQPTESVVIFVPTPSSTAAVQATIIPGTTPNGSEVRPPRLYYAQAGDTVPALAARFAVEPDEITSPEALTSDALITPNQLLIIPDRIGETGPSMKALPDSEIVFSPSAIDFDVKSYTNNAGGYLNEYRESLSNGWLSGAEIIERVAIENSINPRLLLSILEYQSGWVHGKPASLSDQDYPLGKREFKHRGLYRQLSWAVQQLSIGYYGWRAGLVTELTFATPTRQPVLRLAPDLNAGTVALHYLFSKLYDQIRWGGVLYAPDGMPALHETLFGNPWLRAQTVEPLYPTSLIQPELELPVEIGATWSFTGGPHSAWGPDGALAALDFAPSASEHGCVESTAWVTAAAAGLVVRSGDGVVTLDLDGDGYEQTGWALLYLHVETKDRVAKRAWLSVNDRIGHPSCEGGVSTGTHLHIARKFNGEWILADGPVPFELSGWRAHNGEKPYKGKLTKDGQVILASIYGSFESRIIR